MAMTMEDTLIIQRGECLNAQLEYTNEDGTPMNLDTFVLSCSEASHNELLEGAELTFTNAEKGLAALYIPSAVMADIPAGRSSWLRLAVTPGEGGCSSTSMKLWVDIR